MIPARHRVDVIVRLLQVKHILLDLLELRNLNESSVPSVNIALSFFLYLKAARSAVSFNYINYSMAIR